MSEGSGIVDIVIFAMIAAFLVFRLISVLGRRTGHERQRDAFTPPPAAGSAPPRPGIFSGRAGFGRPTAAQPGNRAAGAHPYAVGPVIEGRAVEVAPPPDGPVSLDEGVRHIQAGDPAFTEPGFLQGAQGAFTMIVTAFAAGDLTTLRRLLADAVYADFAHAIEARRQAGETLEAHVLGFETVELTQISLVRGRALCTVRFVTRQTNVTRAVDGHVVDGDPATVEEVTDLWTFARDIRATDPNWQLVETRQA